MCDPYSGKMSSQKKVSGPKHGFSTQDLKAATLSMYEELNHVLTNTWKYDDNDSKRIATKIKNRKTQKEILELKSTRTKMEDPLQQTSTCRSETSG